MDGRRWTALGVVTADEAFRCASTRLIADMGGLSFKPCTGSKQESLDSGFGTAEADRLRLLTIFDTQRSSLTRYNHQATLRSRFGTFGRRVAVSRTHCLD